MRAIRKIKMVFLIEKGDKEKAMNFRKVSEKFINRASIAPKCKTEKGDEKNTHVLFSLN